MQPERQGHMSNSWPGRERKFDSAQEEEAEDPFADEITPVYSRGGRGGSRPQRSRNAFSNPNPFQFQAAEPEDVFDTQQYEDPFADARARNRAQYASSQQWQEAPASVPNAPNSFAAHLLQRHHSGGANVFSASAPQGMDLFHANVTGFASETAFEIPGNSAETGFAFPNPSEAAKPPKYPFKNRRNQPAASSGGSQGNQGLAPRKQFTSFGNSWNQDKVDEWPDPEREHFNNQSWKGDDSEGKVKAHTGERLSLFIRSVPVSLFSTRAVSEHFERLPVTVSYVSLRGSKQKEANRTAVVTFESEQEASLALSKGRVYNGIVLNAEFYEPYGLRKDSRSKRMERRKEESNLPKLIFTHIPRGLGSGRQIKRVLQGFGVVVADVKLTQRHNSDGMERVAIITLWDEEAAEILLKNQPQFNDKRLNISYLDDTKVDDDDVVQKKEKAASAARRASRKESKQKMLEEERLREMEMLRREIARIEERKRQQEARREKRFQQKQKRDIISEEQYENSQSDAQQSKVDAKLPKYGPQQSSTMSESEQWRKVGKKMDIQDAKQLVGVCQKMCPLSEFEARVEQRDISLFELQNGPGSEPDPKNAVKKYRRSAAISEEQKPEEVRPPSVLARTMDHLKQICNSKHAEFYEVHNFVRDRTRSIRQDFTLQGLQDECCIKIHEESVRFHIMSEHRLFGTNPEKFSSKQNLEQLDKCLISLREMYDLRREHKLATSPNEPEMQAYYILTQLSDPQTCVQLWTAFARDVRQSAPVRFALEVVKAAGGQFVNPVKFFLCVRKASYLMACLMHSRFTEMRAQALRLLNATHGSTNSRDEISIGTLTKSLCFEDEEETQRFCELVGFEVFSVVREDISEQVVAPPCRDFDTTRVSLCRKIRSDKVIEAKACQLGPSDIINGATNRSFSDDAKEFLNVNSDGEINKRTNGGKLQEAIFAPQNLLQQPNAIGIRAPRKRETKSFLSKIEGNASDDGNLGYVSWNERPSKLNVQASEKGERGSSLDPISHVGGISASRQSCGEETPLHDMVKPSMSTRSARSINESMVTQIDDKQTSTEANPTAFQENVYNSGKLISSVQHATDTHLSAAIHIHKRKADRLGSDVPSASPANSNAASSSLNLFGDSHIPSNTSKGVGEHDANICQQNVVEPLTTERAEKQASHLTLEQQGGQVKSVDPRSAKDVSGKSEIERERDDQKRLRERASKVVEERQRVVAIARKTREDRYKRRCEEVLKEFAMYAKHIERSLETVNAVLRSLNAEEMSRSDGLNTCHSGFELLDRSVSLIKGAEDFLEGAKGWSWEGKEFPQSPFVAISELREKGRAAWEKMRECRKELLLKSPEAFEDAEYVRKGFENRKQMRDMPLQLEMFLKKMADRIPISSLPTNKPVQSPGLEVDTVFQTLKRRGVLQWQAVIVGEQQKSFGSNAITTAWLRSRLGEKLRGNEMVINARNKDLVQYPCLSILQMDSQDDLPVTASTIIWSMDGSSGESGFQEEQKIIEECLHTLHSQSRAVLKPPPFLILVCFNSKGPMSPGLKAKLDQGCSSPWSMFLLNQGLVCGVRSVALSREIVMELAEDCQFTKDIQESVTSHQRLSMSHGVDTQLHRLDERLVEVGNNAWMDVLDRQLSRSYHSNKCSELVDVIRNINKKWQRVAESVSNTAKTWPVELTQHRVHFAEVGAELMQRLKLPTPTERDGQSYAGYLRLLCTEAGIAFPRLQHDGFKGLAEFCRSMGFIMPRIVSSLLRDLKDVKVPFSRIIQGEEARSRVRRLNLLFSTVFADDGNSKGRDVGDRNKNDSNLGKRYRNDVDNAKEGVRQKELGSPSRRRRLSLIEEYRGGGETPKRRYSLPWKTFGSQTWSERLEFMVAEAEAFGNEIDSTIELLKKRRRLTQSERSLIVSR
ncbi:unnamed protein product [Agarophyton chilense]|eukprot:gb/GEZJ01003314.1/.p1 GENE.gb/GEZJ01003314.1/~~gb/GEZJ01003314.1/.p1  ORF type:complete len:1899 (+),score=283.09 gb/GEZJ01003314.1/:284-5980(+)